MKIQTYMKEHLILSIGKSISSDCLIVEAIVDNPKELIELVINEGFYISEIRWWDRVLITEGSKIGYGGPRDPKDPKNYYFAETDICNKFAKETTILDYVEYLQSIKRRYPSSNIHPAFSIYKKQ